MESAVEIRGLTRSYPGFSLGPVSLSLPRGRIMGLIGPNGAGKTTIVRLLMGLARPQAGEIEILGRPLAGDDAELRARMGFVQEAPALYGHLTVERTRSLIAPYFERWDEERFRALAEEMELPLRKKVGALSKGLRTRLALALALSHHAELLVLDEPTSGLDPSSRRRLLKMLQAETADERSSVLLCTHVTSDLERMADYISYLDHGALVFSTTRDELRERWAVVKGPPELAAQAVGPLFHGLRLGEVSFQAVTSDAPAARKLLGKSALLEPASLDEIVEHVSRRKP